MKTCHTVINPIFSADPNLKNDVGFCIGNGTSRRGFDLNRLTGKGITVGCNYLYRHYDPDFIVAIDEPIVQDIQAEIERNKNRRWKFLARNYLDGRFWWLVADGERVVRFASINHRLNLNSGILASYFLSCTLKVKTLYLFGVDFFRPMPNGADNSIYFGVDTYHPKIADAWNLLVRDHPGTKFIRVGKIPEHDREWYETELKGFEFIDYKDLPF